MEVLFDVLRQCVDLMKMPFTVFGFELSFWGILLYGLIAVIVIRIIVEVFS